MEKEAGYTSWYGIRYGIGPFGRAYRCKLFIISIYGQWRNRAADTKITQIPPDTRSVPGFSGQEILDRCWSRSATLARRLTPFSPGFGE